jgi:peptide/nickel transport system permease protein
VLDYVVGRLLRLVITVWAIVSIVFFATRLTGDAINFLMPEGLDAQSRALYTAYLGLDRPILDQYFLYWRSLLEGNPGLSLAQRRSVVEIFSERWGQSAALLLSTMCLTIIVGVPLGIFTAIWREKLRGKVVLFTAFLAYTVPNFVLAIVLLLLFSAVLKVLPSAGSATPLHYVMPTIALAAYFIAALVRYTRAAMLDVLSQDFMRTARAKGLSERAVILRHGLRNALIPVITVLGLQVTTLVSGAVVIETVFAWNGVGDLLVNATLLRDYPVLQFGVVIVAVSVVAVNILVDFAYVAIDPRVRLSGERAQ